MLGIIFVVVLSLVWFSFIQYLYCWDKIEFEEREARHQEFVKRYRF